ncbi:MAG: aminoacyl-tRNA hydrolase [Candidatus Sungbacteria bacterium]|uniref:Aminoacyl-tRNA hydrolase n=1 Tax=Candidatus Sungiibacteriota bacterium TaxID=2750080 RepID=A0A931YDM9_9BACT|nr:aminoacyl-tRNA hydrolase [Candidatus Sungbacteria bacterium]MBI2465955.1 aminoacyl-tRNA hydrolase [Candidatus Sungbacteria bacterium]
MKVIVGLGNPGDKYQKTRHNTGEFYLTKLRNAWSEKDFTESKTALWLETKISGVKTYLIFPTEMMNNSGNSLKKTLTKLKINPKPADILVVHDDLDIGLGRMKMSFGRSSAGHNGVESVIKMLKTNKFWRLRVGIGLKKKPDGKKLIDFILKKFSPAEERVLNKNFKKISASLATWLTQPEKAMSEINSF